MGNYLCGPSIRISDTAAAAAAEADFVRLVHPDGSMHSLEAPVSVAELMLDHPQHFVCDASSNRPLPADHQLVPCEFYYLVSGSSKGQRKSFASEALIGMKQINGGVTQVTVSQDFVTRLMCAEQQQQQDQQQQQQEQDDDEAAELELAHRMRMNSLRCTSWRPKLATIDESIY